MPIHRPSHFRTLEFCIFACVQEGIHSQLLKEMKMLVSSSSFVSQTPCEKEVALLCSLNVLLVQD